MIRFSAFATILLLSLPAHADISGFIFSVHDGDSVTLVTDDHHKIKIRAADIDAPELDQPFGDAARQAMDDLVYRKRVRKRVTITGEHPDQYGRTVGRITIGGGTVANVEMVRQAMAWVYTRYSTDRSLRQTRAAHRGLWRDDAPIEPWIWRRTHPPQFNARPWATPTVP